MERLFPAIPLSIEIHTRAVLDLATVASSLYSLGSRVKAEAAHVEAEISYTRLLGRLDRFDGGQAGWSQAVQQQIQEALRHITTAHSAAHDKRPTAPTAMFYTAASS